MKLDRILVVFGTRPEAIKMAPVVHVLRSSSAFQVKVCVTAQHRELLNQVLATFSITPDFDLNLMQPNQQLADLTARVLCGMSDLYRACRPDLVLVHGDTTTTFAASLAAFYERIPMAHVEAGLRSHDKYSPWPEEINRCLASVLATWHFAPTVAAKANLLLEGINPQSVIVTGNTIVDAVQQIVSRFDEDSKLRDFYDRRFSYLDPTRRLLLVTAHRRDSFGEGFKRICAALQQLALRKDVEIVYAVHPNENVCKPVQKMLGGIANIHLIAPQEYLSFVYLLRRCRLILTDSGGIQEEGTFLRKAVLLMRDTTERPEAVDTGAVKIVGTDVRTIVERVGLLLDDHDAYQNMIQTVCPFGDGHAAHRIVKHLELSKGVEVSRS